MDDEDALTENEFLTACHCFKHDEVKPLKPLVEKYGWVEFLERFDNSAVTVDS